MKYEHEIIRDLMPLCADDIASPQSEAAVKEHIAACEECAAEWEQMQKGIDTGKKDDEEAKRYAETAKRVRKHDRRVAACVLASLLLIAFIGAVIASYHDGARFTLRGAVKYGVVEMHGLQYELEYNLYGRSGPDVIDPEEKPEITYLGEILIVGQSPFAVFPYNLPKNMWAYSYVLVNLPKKNETYFCAYRCDRNDPDRLFMWNSSGLHYEPLEDGINMIYKDYPHTSAAFYSTDNRVKTIQFEFIHVKWTVDLDENHFGAIRLNSGHGMEITNGTATDKDGNVLYKTENSVEIIDGNEQTVTRWVKVG